MPTRFASGITAIILALSLTAAHGETFRPTGSNVFVGMEGGYHTYAAPALAVTDAGTILAFCEARRRSPDDHGDVDILLRRSEDRGSTWSEPVLVAEEGGDSDITIGNPCVVIDRETDAIWLLFCRDNERVFVTGSEDDGVTWSAAREITSDVMDPDWIWYGTGPGAGIQLTQGEHRGRLLVPCYRRTPPDPDAGLDPARLRWVPEAFRAHVVISDDHGRTWRVGGEGAVGTSEGALAELGDGSVMLNTRYQGALKVRHVDISRDDGESFSPLPDVEPVIDPECQAGLVSHVDPENGTTLVFSNPAQARTRITMTMRLSTDDGRTWSAGRGLWSGAAGYSCLAVLDDGSLGVLFEAGRYRPREGLLFVRFSLDWVNGEPVPPRPFKTVEPQAP